MLSLLVSAGLLAMLSNIASALAVNSPIFAGDGGTFMATPSATFSAPSRLACLAACTSRGVTCEAFTWHVDGTCDVYDAGVVTTSTSSCYQPPDAAAGRVSYQLLSAFLSMTTDSVTCRGTVADPCECPTGFLRCAGRCLIRATELVSYTDAENICAAMNAHLFSPRTDAENACAHLVRDYGHWAWLGFNDLAVEGVFEGADGCGPYPIDGPRWGWWGEPDNYLNSEHCVSMVTAYEDYWSDRPCTEQYFPICMLNDCYKGGCP